MGLSSLHYDLESAQERFTAGQQAAVDGPAPGGMDWRQNPRSRTVTEYMQNRYKWLEKLITDLRPRLPFPKRRPGVSRSRCERPYWPIDLM
jgi:hypothetical protein